MSQEAQGQGIEPATTRRRKFGTRDGLFQRHGWWWLDFTDADGKRHRKKAAPDYATAKIIYRQTMTAIARGEVLGVREEGKRFRDFVEQRYWPTVKPTLSPWEQERTRATLDRQILPRFGDAKLSKFRREDIERWQADRLGEGGSLRGKKCVVGATSNKELMRLKHILNRAVAWGYLKDSPARPVKKVKEAPGRVRYLTAEERETLLNAAPPTLRPYILAALTDRRAAGRAADPPMGRRGHESAHPQLPQDEERRQPHCADGGDHARA